MRKIIILTSLILLMALLCASASADLSQSDNDSTEEGSSNTSTWEWPIDEELIQQLPEALTRIEAEAFAGTAFSIIEIPPSVTYIADDAFTGSSVELIIGSSDYVRQYAEGHDIDYLEREWSKPVK